MYNNLSNAFLKNIGKYMLIETPLAKADVCLLFGNNDHAVELAERAADLYHQGYFDKIISSTGVPMKDGRRECDVMRDVLISKGVPASAILVEGKSRNTGENVIESKALLEDTFGKGVIKSAVVIYHIHASRRALMTLQKHWPELIKMFATVNCYAAPKEQWYNDPVFKEDVLREYAKIAPYKAQGFITEIIPDNINRQIATLPQPDTHKQALYKNCCAASKSL